MSGRTGLAIPVKKAVAGLLLCLALALYAAVGGIAPAEAKMTCTAYSDHGACVEWTECNYEGECIVHNS